MFTYSNKKKILRDKYAKERSSFAREEILDLSQIIAENFKKKFNIETNDWIQIYLAIAHNNEIDTQSIIQYCWGKGANVVVPKIFGNTIASIRLLPETQLQNNKWGILQPVSNQIAENQKLDYAIVPLLYCDHAGNRIGYGKGFYDRFFAENNHKDVIKIGLSIFSPNEAVEDVDSHDVALDYLVTPMEVLSFGDSKSKFSK